MSLNHIPSVKAVCPHCRENIVLLMGKDKLDEWSRDRIGWLEARLALYEGAILDCLDQKSYIAAREYINSNGESARVWKE